MTKGVWGNGDKALQSLNPGTRQTWVVSFMPQPHYPQKKEAPYPVKSRLGGLQNQSQHFGKDKNLSLPTLIKTQFLGHPVHSPLTILSWTPKSLHTKNRK